MKDKEEQQARAMYEHYNYRCFVCNNPAIERAHVIGNTKVNRRLYGNRVVDSPLNWLPACGLDHNAKIDIGRNDIIKEQIALIIETNDLDETEKRQAIEAIVNENIQRKEGKLDRRIYV